MVHRVMPARLQNIIKSDYVTLDIDVRVLYAIADAGLRRQIHHNGKAVLPKKPLHQVAVRNRPPDKVIPVLRMAQRSLLNDLQTILLQRRVIIIIQIVQSHDMYRLRTLQQPQHQISADKTGRTGNKNTLHRATC